MAAHAASAPSIRLSQGGFDTTSTRLEMSCATPPPGPSTLVPQTPRPPATAAALGSTLTLGITQCAALLPSPRVRSRATPAARASRSV